MAQKIFENLEAAELRRYAQSRAAHKAWKASVGKMLYELGQKEVALATIQELELMLISGDPFFNSETIFIEMMAQTDNFLTQTATV